MGCALQFFAFFFLIIAIGTEITSFTTSYMIESRFNIDDHEGIFSRCFPVRGCKFWSSTMFEKDPKWLQSVVVLSFISLFTLAVVTLNSLIAFVPKCRSRNLNIFNGILMIFNEQLPLFTIYLLNILLIQAVLLSGIVTIYTTLNDKGVTFNANQWNFSWGYWLFYGAIGLNVLTSILFCCNTATTGQYKYEY